MFANQTSLGARNPFLVHVCQHFLSVVGLRTRPSIFSNLLAKEELLRYIMMKSKSPQEIYLCPCARAGLPPHVSIIDSLLNARKQSHRRRRSQITERSCSPALCWFSIGFVENSRYMSNDAKKVSPTSPFLDVFPDSRSSIVEFLWFWRTIFSWFVLRDLRDEVCLGFLKACKVPEQKPAGE